MSNAELRTHPEDPDREVADLPSACVQAHAANLMVLHDGTLACVWFGGSMEGRSDISVYMARLDAGARRWSEPTQLSNDAERSEQNPILFPVPGGPLWLLHTAQLSGNQDTAIVRRRVSHDNGKSWGETETLADAPAGTFVRQPIHVHTDGTWLLPIFECRVLPGQKWDGSLDESAVLRSTNQGASWQPIPVPDSVGCVHMSIVPAAGNSLLGFFRSRWADNIYMTRSDDGGLSWRKPVPTALPNNNSSIQALRLADGRLALILNASSAADATERRDSLYDELEDQAPSTPEAPAQQASKPARRAFWGAPRAPMTLALSEDDGQTWPWQRNLETGDGWCMSNDSARGLNREYSYPSLRQTADGALHVAYTVFRKHIRHARVMPDWITQAPGQ
ncbi:exo-alpha-sialidase [Variovorax humicola]|uniref:Exo-alpha-sialidase n=1 Tax=Variovorax humicola TaxID=1769758 RepID=A0ABU8W7P7_9BURK